MIRVRPYSFQVLQNLHEVRVDPVRLPVGSSARSISGRFTRVRATATPGIIPPESWVGR